MARSVNIAFQGGGARFISLLAAAHAIWELQREEKIEVKSVSGSSAGSIAAFLLSQNVDFEAVREAIRDNANAIEKKFPIPTRFRLFIGVVLFYLFGKPLYKKKDFDEIILDVLEKVGINPINELSHFEAQGKKLYIMVSDVYQSRSKAAASSERLREALWSSCSIPVVFSTYNSFNYGQDTDAGVFNNLPTDILIAENRGEGPVFAVGFPPTPIKPAKSALAYLLSLVSSTIAHREAHSRSLVGDRFVLNVNTELTTFDFDKIVTIGLRREYIKIKTEARNFLLSWLAGDDLEEQKHSAPLLELKLRANEADIIDFIEKNWLRAKGRTEYIKLKVTANCLRRSDEPDEIQVEQLSQIPVGAIVPGLSLPMMGGSGEYLATHCDLRFDGPDGEAIPFKQIVIEHKIQDKGTATRRNTVILLIEGDLSRLSGKRLYALKKETRYGFMAPLRVNGADTLTVRSIFWDTVEASIQLNLPEEFGDVQADWEGLGDVGGPIEREAQISSFPARTKAFLACVTPVPHGSGIKLSLRREK